MSQIKKSLLVLCIGILIGYAFSFLQTQEHSPKLTKKPEENKTLLTNYFPIKEGSFWEYTGTRKEQIEGKIETSELRKRVKVNTIRTEAETNEVSITNDKQTEKWIVKDNTIDFDLNEQEDKFILTFPLYVGQKWGDEYQLKNRDDGYYVWEVEQKLSQKILGKKYNDCFRIAYKTLSDTQYKIFCYGIGIVEEGYKHNGTVFEEIYKLTSYQDHTM